MGIEQIGMKASLGYLLFSGNNPLRAKENIIHALEKSFKLFVDAQPHLFTENEQKEHMALSTTQPYWKLVLHGHMVGKYTGEEVIAITSKLAKDNNLFPKSAERYMVKRIINCIFNGSVLARYTQPIESTREIIQELSQQEEHTLFILSNYGKDAFESLSQTSHGQSVLNYFDPNYRFISGFLGTKKPMLDTYNPIIEEARRLGHEPDDIIFIDDLHCNIAQAENHGITGYHYAGEKACGTKLREFLQEKGVLPESSLSKKPL